MGAPWPQLLTVPPSRVQAVLITDPELAREVLHSPHLDKFRYLYSFLDPFLGGTNLLTGHTDAHWKAVRKGVAPAFSAGNMRCARGCMPDGRPVRPCLCVQAARLRCANTTLP